jgi:hypothetical protein
MDPRSPHPVTATFELSDGKPRVRIVQRGFPSPVRRDTFQAAGGAFSTA